MKKLYLLLPILFLIYWSCDDENSIIECDSSEVELWGNCYSIENTTYLNYSSNQLTGSIPPEIWYLTNLTFIRLNNNQLTGEIPESICNLSIDWGGSHNSWNNFDLSNNQLCPPYPSCIEDYVREQDTSDCP